MVESWATSPSGQALGIDLHVEPTGSGLRKGLTDALRDAVRSGRLAPGVRLPSSRTLAADLGIARNTVADAYADLVAEGWLTARQGSGTRVAERPVEAPRPPRHAADALLPDSATTCTPAPPTSPRSRAPNGSRHRAAPSTPPRTTPSATAMPAAASNCAPPSPATSPAPAASTPTRTAS